MNVTGTRDPDATDRLGTQDQERMHPRAARVKREEAYDYLAHLEFARRAKRRLGGDVAALNDQIIGFKAR